MQRRFETVVFYSCRCPMLQKAAHRARILSRSGPGERSVPDKYARPANPSQSAMSLMHGALPLLRAATQEPWMSVEKDSLRPNQRTDRS